LSDSCDLSGVADPLERLQAVVLAGKSFDGQQGHSSMLWLGIHYSAVLCYLLMDVLLQLSQERSSFARCYSEMKYALLTTFQALLSLYQRRIAGIEVGWVEAVPKMRVMRTWNVHG